MSGTTKKYTLGDKVYEQKPLVLGQIRQLAALLKGVAISKGTEQLEIIAALGDKISPALAIVLTPEGAQLHNKDLPALAAEIEFSISPDQVCEVVEDFFDCNPIVSLLERVSGTFTSLSGKMKKPIVSENLSVSSPAEILPGETASSGDSPLTSADPT